MKKKPINEIEKRAEEGDEGFLDAQAGRRNYADGATGCETFSGYAEEPLLNE